MIRVASLQRILIVDDDPSLLELLSETLQTPGRRIEVAHDGLEGLSFVEAAAYDLILTDVKMPGLDGLALLERIRKIRPEAKVAVMTVDNTPENVLRALRERAFAFLSKPFAVRAVRDLVDRALASGEWEDDIEVVSASPHWLSLHLRCKMETADRILQFLREMGTDLPPAERENIATAFREILLNAIEHGGGNDPGKRVYISYLRTARSILYYVRDPGKGFSFEHLPHAAVSNPEASPFERAQLRERMGMRPGGFGLLMTRQLVDEMIYNEAGNEVLLIKYLA